MKMVIMSTLLYCNECNVINGENTTLPFIDINQWILGYNIFTTSLPKVVIQKNSFT